MNSVSKKRASRICEPRQFVELQAWRKIPNQKTRIRDHIPLHVTASADSLCYTGVWYVSGATELREPDDAASTPFNDRSMRPHPNPRNCLQSSKKGFCRPRSLGPQKRGCKKPLSLRSPKRDASGGMCCRYLFHFFLYSGGDTQKHDLTITCRAGVHSHHQHKALFYTIVEEIIATSAHWIPMTHILVRWNPALFANKKMNCSLTKGKPKRKGVERNRGWECTCGSFRNFVPKNTKIKKCTCGIGVCASRPNRDSIGASGAAALRARSQGLSDFSGEKGIIRRGRFLVVWKASVGGGGCLRAICLPPRKLHLGGF